MLLIPSFASPVPSDPTPISPLFPPAPAGAAVPADPALPGAVPADFAALFAGLAPEPKPLLPAATPVLPPRGEGVAPRGDLWTAAEAGEIEPGVVALPAELSESVVAPVPPPETLSASLPVFVSTCGPKLDEARSSTSPRRTEPALRRELPPALTVIDDPELQRDELPAEALVAALAFAGLPILPASETETVETPEVPTDADAMADEEPEMPEAERTVGSAPSPTPRPDPGTGFAQAVSIAAREPAAAPASEPKARLPVAAPVEREARPVQPRDTAVPAIAVESGPALENPAADFAPVAAERVAATPTDDVRPRIAAAAPVTLPTPADSRPVVRSSPAPRVDFQTAPEAIAPAVPASASAALPDQVLARGPVQLRAVAVSRPVASPRVELTAMASPARTAERVIPVDSFAAEPDVTSSSRLAAWAPAAAATALPAVSANIAVPTRATGESISSVAENEFKTFLNAREQELTPRSETLGIAVAILPATMPPALAAAPEAHPTFEYAGAWPVATAPEAAVATTPAGLTSGEIDAPRAAHRAVESVLSTVDRLADAPRRSVELDFSVGEVELAVRVELRGEEVRTTFRTDSPELRAALSQEWQSAAASHQGERAVRFAAPVIAGSDQPPAQSSFGGDPAFSQQQGRQMRHGGTDTPHFAGTPLRPAAAPAASAPAPAAVAMPLAAPGARRLNRFA